MIVRRVSSLIFAAALCGCITAPPGASTVSETRAPDDGAQDFDFFVGDWIVENRKLLKPLEGSDQWETFQARQRNQELPGGIGNFDDFVAESWRPGFVGMSLRIFNPETKLWSIYWLNNRNGGIDSKTGALTPPVVGKFRNGIGVFEATDEFNGKPIVVRYTWSRITTNNARWEQAFSPDLGKSWETNWIMDLVRVAK
jgi:hypothetical protein